MGDIFFVFSLQFVLLVLCISLYFRSKKTSQTQFLLCMWQLCVQDGLQQALLQSECLKAVSSAMRQLRSEPDVQSPGCGFLGNLSVLDRGDIAVLGCGLAD